MRVHELLLHQHVGAMSEYPLDHCRHFRRRTGLELGVNTDGVLFAMPIDHDPSTSVACMPLRHQILIAGLIWRGNLSHTCLIRSLLSRYNTLRINYSKNGL